MIHRLLVANRGEIAVRVIRAARDLGIGTVAVFSAADRGAMHARLADRAICIGPAAAASSYLHGDLLLQVAQATGCDAVHPGYGFLAEDASFAERTRQSGLVFVGPPPQVIEQMGDKAAARQLAARAGVPVLPGSDVVTDTEDAGRIAAEIGYPVLLKARAGGGGKGMRAVADEAELRAAFPLARAEAESSFGDGGIYVEKYLSRARHVEIQVLADSHGQVSHLGERDCSVQRRHQKLLEEAPSPALRNGQRQAVAQAAVRAAQEARYVGAGTVEFIVDTDSGGFYFIEMNARIQVEHPVTEMLTGVDLVAWQLRIAAGDSLPAAGWPESRGHAIECRINAEDWRRSFMPSPGALATFDPPAGPGVRVDTHCFAGATIPPCYDSLLAKLIVHGWDRDEALRRARRALREFRVEPVATTIGLHRWLLTQPEITAGTYTTRYLTQALTEGAAP